MNRHVESFWETVQENLKDAHNKHESSFDKLVSYIENELNLTDDQYEKMDELIQKTYSTLEDIKFEIL